MRVLVTGNKGYIGSVLMPMLQDRGYEVSGCDVGYYESCILSPIAEDYPHSKKDIRDIAPNDLKGIDAVIHLAGLSNDPLGELAPRLTEEINLHGTLKLAKCAKQSGVSRFVYSSSQSMYGISRTESEIDEDSENKNPITAYARTKWLAECELMNMQSRDFNVVCFRPSTVFGVSPRLRCDIVYNNLVACAYTTGSVEIKSDGSPSRPVVHVRDVSSAFIVGLEAPLELISGQAFNVGIKDGNFTVRQLAESAQRLVSNSKVIFTGEHGADSRSYRVSFSRILTKLGDYFSPEWGLDRGGEELVGFFQDLDFKEKHFRGERVNRLEKIKSLVKEGRLTDELRWK